MGLKPSDVTYGWRAILTQFAVAALVSTSAYAAPKPHSLLVLVSAPREQALDATVAAFTAAGLRVTNTTTLLVESDLGASTSGIYQSHYVVRAVSLVRDSVNTGVIITGTETGTRALPSGRTFVTESRVRGGKIWQRMVAAAQALEEHARTPAPARTE